MRCRSFVSSVLLILLVVGILPTRLEAAEPFVERRFDTSIDAFSARFPADEARFSYSFLHADTWSDWILAESDGDVLPGEESELIMLPEGTSGLRVRNIESADDIHPITVSKDPVRVRMAATNTTGLPKILSRSDWGAEEDYLYAQPSDGQSSSSEADATKGDNGGVVVPAQRTTDCEQAQTKYPQEFKTSATVTKDAQGREYLWPLQYSQNVRLLVVHHSALKIEGDPRPAVERVRALYKYHASSKGWGDVGYHYLIDENGQVYEGRQGGEKVVGGHAYCNNVGTVGIVLLGNFEMEQPTQKQAKSLQHLLSDLGREYGLDFKKSTQFHGKAFTSPVVRHKDLLSTLCPGYYLSESFGQIVRNVQSGSLDGSVTFPQRSVSSSSAPSTLVTTPGSAGVQEGITFTGRTSIAINPGGKQRLSFAYTAGAGGAYEGKKVADVRLDTGIRLYVGNGSAWIPVTKGILLPSDLPGYETVSLQLLVEAPMNAGTYDMDVAGIRFTMSVQGRRARTGTYVSPFTGSPTASPVRRQSSSSAISSRIRPQSRRSLQSTVSNPNPSPSPSSSSSSATSSSLPPLRIRLSASANPTVRFAENGTVNGMPVRAGTALSLVTRGGVCEALSNGISLTSGNGIRFISDRSGILTVDGIAGKTRSYRGALECRIVNDSLVLINELQLEDYLRGLAEEPDSEPYEKQRAFAIAARTYAAYYMNPSVATRKFPGMPYDGSDDPATFQSYAGIGFEAANPNWLRAVESTSNQVMKYAGQLFKPAYFSSDDGRTRTPLEAGWKNFPAAEIFSSKPDPWCEGLTLRGHGVGMSGCGAKGQANEGKTGEQILQYYYPGAKIVQD